MSISIKESGIFLAGLLICNLVSAAEPFTANEQPVGYLQPMALSTTNLHQGAKGYRPWFENGAWQGDLIEYTINATGAATTSVDLTGLAPLNSSGSNWSARMEFSKAEATDSSYWTNSRKIITHKNDEQIPFRWGNLSKTQKQQLDNVSYTNLSTSSPILDFVRGDRSNEKPSGTLRTRYNLLGDIIHSNPVYVGAPTGNMMSASYIAFKDEQTELRKEKHRVYVGANDGMLHVFDANTGKEVYAFIPPEVIPKLDNLSDDPYYHEYYVDGELSVHDAFFTGAWHTVLIGSLGAGGSSRFALDVTNPDLSSEDAPLSADNKVLWIQNSSTNAALGDAYGKASIAQLPDEKYYVISGNGYNSAAGVAELVLTELSSGTITTITTLTTDPCSDSDANGLSTPALVDLDSDGLFDFAYAGDLNGNLWKFDLTTKSVAYSKPLYAAGVSQPITTKPSVSSHPLGGKLVYFATGTTLTSSDLADTSPQGVYAIWDNGNTPGNANLLSQTLSAIKTIGSQSVQTISNTAIDWSTHTGWTVSLTSGNRVVTNHQFRDKRMQMTVTNPLTEENWMFEPNYLNGGPPDHTIFDIDGNGVLEPADNVGASNKNTDIAVAWQIGKGVMSGPIVARISDGIDTKFVNYSKLPEAPEPCTEGCSFLGGHIDLDTDAPVTAGNGYAGKTTKHTHEYDKKVLQPYVDYFQINDGDPGQLQVDEVITDRDKKFMVIVANADLSPKSTLQIGLNSYNVLEYQKMIQRKLENWDGELDTLKDKDLKPLIVSINDIQAGGGTLRNSFDNHAIFNGGLHPTTFSCVMFDLQITNERWRNGSLIIQLIDPEKVKSLSDLYIQNPDDLPASVTINNHEIYLKEDVNDDEEIDNDINGDDKIDVYGGLRGKGTGKDDSADNGVLYESALFWHYGTLAKYRGLVKYRNLGFGEYEDVPCYGESGYEESIAAERVGITEQEYSDMLADQGYVSIDGVYASIEDIITLCESSETENQCRRETTDAKGNTLEVLLALADLSEYLHINTDTGYGLGNAEIVGIPLPVASGNKSAGIIAGPDFIKGRRTWVDISKQ